MSTQTAVEWLVDMLDIDSNDSATKEVIKQAKEMERKQIVDAVDGFPVAFRHNDGEAYYNDIYKGGDK